MLSQIKPRVAIEQTPEKHADRKPAMADNKREEYGDGTGVSSMRRAKAEVAGAGIADDSHQSRQSRIGTGAETPNEGLHQQIVEAGNKCHTKHADPYGQQQLTSRRTASEQYIKYNKV